MNLKDHYGFLFNTFFAFPLRSSHLCGSIVFVLLTLCPFGLFAFTSRLSYSGPDA